MGRRAGLRQSAPPTQAVASACAFWKPLEQTSGALSLLTQPLERLPMGEKLGNLLLQCPGVGALTLRGEQGPLLLRLGMVAAVQDQILHNLPIGLRGGAPVQQDSGWCQRAQAQVRWGRRRACVHRRRWREAGSLRAPAGRGGSWETGHEAWPLFFLLNWDKPQSTMRTGL